MDMSFMKPIYDSIWRKIYLAKFSWCVVIFLEIHKHHKRLSHSASPISLRYRQKRRQNFRTTAGHFASWMVEIVFYVIIHYLILGHRELVRPLAIFLLMQSLKSQDHREQAISLKLWSTPSCLCLKYNLAVTAQGGGIQTCCWINPSMMTYGVRCD